MWTACFCLSSPSRGVDRITLVTQIKDINFSTVINITSHKKKKIFLRLDIASIGDTMIKSSSITIQETKRHAQGTN